MKKLSLERETLAPLSSSELENVNGGTGALCRATWAGIKWLTRNACPSITIETATRVLGCNGNGGGNQAPQQ
jgi:hypothetical protein